MVLTVTCVCLIFKVPYNVLFSRGLYFANYIHWSFSRKEISRMHFVHFLLLLLPTFQLDTSLLYQPKLQKMESSLERGPFKSGSAVILKYTSVGPLLYYIPIKTHSLRHTHQFCGFKFSRIPSQSNSRNIDPSKITYCKVYSTRYYGMVLLEILMLYYHNFNFTLTRGFET